MVQENVSLGTLLLQSRIVFIGDTISPELSNTVVSALLYLDSQSHEPIKLYINSPGGIVSAGFAIIDTMHTIESPVETVCVGMAASMAAVILACGEKGKRSMLQNSEVMIHQPLGGSEGQAADIAIVARHILKTKDKIYKLLSDMTGQTVKRIEHDADRNFWMDAEEAVKYGMADSIIIR